MSLAQGHYCVRKHLDPEDPRCAHIILTGKIVEVRLYIIYCESQTGTAVLNKF